MPVQDILQQAAQVIGNSPKLKSMGLGSVLQGAGAAAMTVATQLEDIKKAKMLAEKDKREYDLKSSEKISDGLEKLGKMENPSGVERKLMVKYLMNLDANRKSLNLPTFFQNADAQELALKSDYVSKLMTSPEYKEIESEQDEFRKATLKRAFFLDNLGPKLAENLLSPEEKLLTSAIQGRGRSELSRERAITEQALQLQKDFKEGKAPTISRDIPDFGEKLKTALNPNSPMNVRQQVVNDLQGYVAQQGTKNLLISEYAKLQDDMKGSGTLAQYQALDQAVLRGDRDAFNRIRNNVLNQRDQQVKQNIAFEQAKATQGEISKVKDDSLKLKDAGRSATEALSLVKELKTKVNIPKAWTANDDYRAARLMTVLSEATANAVREGEYKTTISSLQGPIATARQTIKRYIDANGNPPTLSPKARVDMINALEKIASTRLSTLEKSNDLLRGVIQKNKLLSPKDKQDALEYLDLVPQKKAKSEPQNASMLRQQMAKAIQLAKESIKDPKQLSKTINEIKLKFANELGE